jgi:tetratricopeptide (TPR) repeat protein
MAMYGRIIPMGRNDDYDRGLRLFDQGLYEAAIPELEKVIDSGGPENTLAVRLAAFYLAECWSFLGSYALGQQLTDRAATCFQEALKRNPSYADLHCKLGSVYVVLEKITEADEEFVAALAINPDYARALVEHGLCQYRLGNPVAGFASVTSGFEKDPSLSVVHYQLGKAAHEGNDFGSALAEFALLTVTDIDDIAYHSRLGSDFFRRGMLDQASRAFEKAVELNPDYADLHNSLGMTYHSSGKYGLALEEFKKALEINPSYVDALNNFALSAAAAKEFAEVPVHLELVQDGPSGRRNSGS